MQKKKQKTKGWISDYFCKKPFRLGLFLVRERENFPKTKKKKKTFQPKKEKKEKKKRHRAVLVSKFRNLGVDKSQPLLLRVQASLDHSSTRTRTTTVTTTLYPKKKKLNEINKHKSRDWVCSDWLLSCQVQTTVVVRLRTEHHLLMGSLLAWATAYFALG